MQKGGFEPSQESNLAKAGLLFLSTPWSVVCGLFSLHQIFEEKRGKDPK